MLIKSRVLVVGFLIGLFAGGIGAAYKYKSDWNGLKSLPIGPRSNSLARNQKLPEFSPQDGSYFSYSFTLRNIVSHNADEVVSAGDQFGNQKIVVTASGSLNIKFYALSNGGINAAVKITDPKVTVNEKPSKSQEHLALPFYFSIAKTGKISEPIFIENISIEEKNLLSQIVWQLQALLPNSPVRSWFAKERDNLGEYQAWYQVADFDQHDDHVKIKKQKQFYHHSESFEPNSLEVPSVEKSDIEYKLSQTDGSWKNINFHEILQLFRESRKFARMETFFAMDYKLDSVANFFPSDFRDFLAQSKVAGDQYKNQYFTDPYLNSLTKNLSLKQIINLFSKLKNSTSSKEQAISRELIANYLRQYPEMAFSMIDFLDDEFNQVDSDTYLRLWYYLAKSNTLQAERSLALAATDDRYKKVTQLKAVEQMFALEQNVESATFQKLWDHYDDLADVKSEAEAEIKSSTILAIGALGSKQLNNAAVASQTDKKLADSLSNARTLDDEITVLESIGNYGSETMIETVDQYFESSERQLRSHAYSVFRNMNSQKSSEALIKHYQTEKDDYVKISALKVLAKMQPNETNMAWARGEIFNFSRPEGQLALVSFLGDNLKKFPENEQILRSFAKKTDLTVEAKKLIYKYIAPSLANR